MSIPLNRRIGLWRVRYSALLSFAIEPSRERQLALLGKVAKPKPEHKKEVPTLEQFAERFIGDGVAQNQKPSTIAAKHSILKTHLIPLLGAKCLDQIRNEEVSNLLLQLSERSAKTKNNTLVVLSVLRRPSSGKRPPG
jgi:hypothetical protein